MGSSKEYTFEPKQPQRMSLVLSIGVLLTVANCYWIIVAEAMWFAVHLTVIAIFYNAVFFLFVLLLINFLLKQLSPRAVLSKAELLMIYMMMCMGSAISGHGLTHPLIPLMGHVFWFATPENDWANLIWPHIPSWMGVRDRKALQAHYMGDSTFYTADHFRAWIIPVLAWASFLFAFVFVFMCINIIFRKHWVEREKLTYPIIQLPLRMIDEPSKLLRNKLLWIGFAIAAGLDLYNELHFIYPSVPYLNLKIRNLARYFTGKPWNTIEWFPISFYPFAIGLGFFIPLDLLFSCWFFFLFLKGEAVIMSVFNIGRRGGSLWCSQSIIEQSSGAYIGLFFIALWVSRRYLIRVLKHIFGINKIDDSKEPMPYRWAFLGLVFGVAYLIGFSYYAGMSLWLALPFFGVYLMLVTSITRMRAELGAPVHDMMSGGSDLLLVPTIGTRNLRPSDLAVVSIYWFFNRAHYSDIMPHQLEGFKLAEHTKTSNRRLLIAMLSAIFVGIFATFWAFLHTSHRIGMTGWVQGIGWRPMIRLQNWLINPTGPDYSTSVHFGIGLMFTFFLMFMRMRFLWWPFHPAGFAVSNSWGMSAVWFPLFIAWCIKGVVLRYGGLRTHQKVIPFFLGIMLGEFIVGCFLSVIGTALGKPVYAFFK